MSEEEAKLAREGRGSFVLTEAEKDARSRARTPLISDEEEGSEEQGSYEPAASLKRSQAFIDLDRDEDEDDAPPPAEEGEDDIEEVEAPDLGEYFDLFPHVSDDMVISMCRAYASYLASISKKKITFGCLPRRSKKKARKGQ